MALTETLGARRCPRRAPAAALAELAGRPGRYDDRNDRGKHGASTVDMELLHLYLLAQLKTPLFSGELGS
jgi:hypothetical protein